MQEVYLIRKMIGLVCADHFYACYSLNLEFYRCACLLFCAVFHLAQRQDHMELAAGEVDLVIAGAFHVDAPAVRFDDAFRQRQSEACAAAFEASLTGGVFA